MPNAAFSLQILTPGDYDSIRVLIDTGLDSDAVPDAVIESPAYGPTAESEVLLRDPNALTYQPGGAAPDDAKWTRVRRAVIFIAAARLCPAVALPITEKLGSYTYTLPAWDAAKRAIELRGLAERELAGYLELDGLTKPLFSFGTACGRRGR
jgi:hypothetical protein